jgi:tripartite-type tricarboxylate transporter receptor subunit TctC
MQRATAATALAAVAMTGALITPDAAAQAFPAKPIRIVVPVAPGGNLDLVTRSVAQKMGESFGQQVLVDNRPGASGVIGTELVMRAPADGYTLLSVSPIFVASPSVVPKIPYDPVRDFAAVSLTAIVPQILVVHPTLPAKTLKQFIALAKSRPGEFTYGTAGNGSTAHFTSELFSRQAGLRMAHVPYKGNAPALVDVVAGQIVLMFDTLSTSLPYVRAGRLQGLAVTSAKRSPVLPDVPTVAEAAVPGYEFPVFNGLMAPAGTPAAVVARLRAEIGKAVATPDIRARFLEQGVELTASESQDQFAAFIRADTAQYAKLAKEIGVRVE